MRIVYISAKFDAPSGGVRTLFRHVELLRAAGLEAVVACSAGGRPDWFASDVPVITELADGDVVVIPEVSDTAFQDLAAAPLTKVVFCQNHFYMFRGLAGRSHWRDFGVAGVMAASRVIAAAVERSFGYRPVPVVRCAVDTALFQPQPKRLQIAMMPRKRKADVPLIHDFFVRLFPRHAGVPWVRLDHAAQDKVAEVLNQSAVFLSLSHREGLGLPPLEAMAAGCVVTGFTGCGGAEYATAANGLWCDEDDPYDCALKLGEALDVVTGRPQRYRTLIEAGRRTVARYSLDGMGQDLLAFWKGFLSALPETPR